MEEYSYDIKIPKDRVAILIGSGGKTKRELEKLSKSKIDVDSKEGEVVISGDNTINLFQLKGIVRAIGRGFNPETAKLLLRQDYVLEVLDITDFVGDKKSHMERIRGRVIGSEGKSRSMIETISNTFVSVYGKTVSIIGVAERADIARHAIEKLLNGAPHGPVYGRLQEEINALKKREALM